MVGYVPFCELMGSVAPSPANPGLLLHYPPDALHNLLAGLAFITD
jgi:hypothetical protein